MNVNEGKRVHEILGAIIDEHFRFEHRTRRGAYCGSLKQELTRAKFLELVENYKFLNALTHAIDAPEDRSVLQRRMAREAKLKWGDIIADLPLKDH